MIFLKIIRNVVKYIKVGDFRVGYRVLLRCLKKKGLCGSKITTYFFEKGGGGDLFRTFFLNQHWGLPMLKTLKLPKNYKYSIF
jgi:hypothetical protein